MKKEMKLNWFKDCKDLQDVKNLYKKLMLFWHPDINKNENSLENSKLINIEYNYILENNYEFNNEVNENNYESEILNRDTYLNIINKLINLEGLQLELIGSWLWVSGSTYLHKDIIKSLGLNFAGAKKMWYYKDSEFKFYKHNKENMSIDNIKAKYGSININQNFKKANFINN